MLYLKELVVNGTNGLEALDRVGWTGASRPKWYSSAAGTVLVPADGASEAGGFELFHLLPLGLVLFLLLAEEGRVDQVPGRRGN